ncbi:hypothetical protein [Paludisphaera mucosa]|uniref:Uncharacterized protein n=1 Tax=Paludisphaera mucosa TaxID=3030827 RepID=A0ABT6FCQ5_9BACT|nr:hypothetical protein [Paludisphaera mucosa]MDG3005224.1 hypothetical protein [Paludisphaera mucosa]
MRRFRAGRLRIAAWMGLVAAFAAGLDVASAQDAVQNDPLQVPNDPLQEAAEGAAAGRPPQGIPPAPPEGAWGEIINATERWIVLQNHSGQQFPIATEDVQEFLIRWPGRIDLISQDAYVEAIGFSPGSNIIRTNHVDYFEGADRTLVSPTYAEVLPNNMAVTTIDPGFNRFMNAWDYGGQNLLYGWAYPIPPGIQGNPARLHVVGALAFPQPLQLAIPGNNMATVLPEDAGGITVTQITRGSSRYIRKGDYAYLMPIEARLRGLRVAQLVVYKPMPLRQFNPDAK